MVLLKTNGDWATVCVTHLKCEDPFKEFRVYWGKDAEVVIQIQHIKEGF